MIDWSKERRKRDKLTAEHWAFALRNAGDYSGYEFSLGHNPAVSFIDDLKHTGDYAGKPFELEMWQEAILRLAFDEEGMPRYRYVFIGLPRKNGKTELVAAIVLYMMLGTGIKQQNLYSGSGDAEQAGLIHKAAAAMIDQNKHLSEVCQVYRGNLKRILFNPLGSEYKALSSEAYSKFGLRPSVNIFDEVHVFPNRELHNSLETAYGATKRPFTIYISTAGWDQTSLCYDLWKRARAARDDPKSDPRFLAILYEFQKGVDDWTSEEVWHRINPGLGKFCGIEEMRNQFDRATRSPIEENVFRQFHLNEWTEQAERWLSVDEWAAGGDWFESDELKGQPCYSGLDMGITGDMAYYAMIFPQPNGNIRVLGHGWAPKDGKWRDELRNEERYLEWSANEWLTLTEGITERDKQSGDPPLFKTVDKKRIKADILKWHKKYPVLSLYADRAYANELLIDLYNDETMNVKGIGQSSLQLNESCVLLEELVLNRQIEHRNNPILNWAVANCSIKRNSTGLMHPNKTVATERIDALSALINALAAYVADPENREPSVYSTPGQLSL